jgi:hypothetical protein
MSQALADQRSYDYLIASLNPKERLYVAARAQGATPVQAAVNAGYAEPGKSADRNEQNLTVRTALEYSLKLAARQARVTRDDVIAGFMDAVRMAGSSAELTQAWREIGKMIGAYEPQRIKVDHTHTITMEQIAALNDDELAELAAIDAEFVALDSEQAELAAP